MSWIALRITPESNRDGVIAALFESGSQGVHEDGATVVTHFPADARVDEIRAAVITADPRADIAIAEAPDADYSQWRASVSSQQVGELVIAPPWLAANLDPEKTILIDPAMAFGTGEHPTTRGAMRLMQAVICPGDFVADLGAGSAVLSIAAAKLGAARVAAVEIDHDSIGNAEENVRINGVGDRVEVIEGDAMLLLPLLAPVRVVLANIISSVLMAMLPAIRSALGSGAQPRQIQAGQDQVTRRQSVRNQPSRGQAILGGILIQERDTMLTALERDGWAVERDDTEDVWWSVQIAPR